MINYVVCVFEWYKELFDTINKKTMSSIFKTIPNLTALWI